VWEDAGEKGHGGPDGVTGKVAPRAGLALDRTAAICNLAQNL
jgi:hypothetical protein